MKDDLISRRLAIEVLAEWHDAAITNRLNNLSSVQLETCEGCKHLGKWEDEIEYGYSSPCICCKRRAEDHYER